MRSGVRSRAILARRAIPLIAAHMARGADEPLFVQRGLGNFCRMQTAVSPANKSSNETIGLFPERGVATDTVLLFFSRVGRHLDQLPHDAGSHRLTVETLFPFVELGSVARAAGTWVESGFERTEMGGWRPLCAKRPSPVLFQEAFDLIRLLSRLVITSGLRRLIATGQS